MVEETISEIEIRGEEYKETEVHLRMKEYLENCVTNANGTIFVLQGYQKKKKREKRIESVIEEVITINFPNLGKEIVSQAMEMHRSPNTRDPRKTTPRHIVIKVAKIKDKDRLLKAARERKTSIQRKTHQGVIRLLNRNLTGQKGVA